MPLETGVYINDLVITNPVGATDTMAGVDDHIRLLKTLIKATFPNIDAVINATPAQLNYLVGATSAIQAQLDGKSGTSHNHSGTYEPVLTAASQLEMEAGIEAAIRSMSPLNVAQAISALSSAVTNLSVASKTSTTLKVASDTGTDATLPAATSVDAGLMSASDKSKLNGINSALPNAYKAIDTYAISSAIASVKTLGGTYPGSSLGLTSGTWRIMGVAEFIDDNLGGGTWRYHVLRIS